MSQEDIGLYEVIYKGRAKRSLYLIGEDKCIDSIEIKSVIISENGSEISDDLSFE